ncbi:MAG: DUF2975 domain-containing protein [Terrimonas sp.]|nr:DUF2975 domain-containing protein [Terrimonas sp.]
MPYQLNRILIPVFFLLALILLLTNIPDKREAASQAVNNAIDNIQPGDIGLDSGNCNRINDSLRWYKQNLRKRLSGSGQSFFNSLVGYSVIHECDTCNLMQPFYENRNQQVRKYFLRIDGYIPRQVGTFFSRPDNDHLNWVTGNSDRVTGARYTSNLNTGNPDPAVLIPVSETSFKTWRILIIVFSIALFIFLFIVVIRMPLLTLYDISTGEVFTRKNINRLRLTGWSLIGMAIIPVIFSWSIGFLFPGWIPKTLYFPFWESLFDNKNRLLAGVIIFIIQSAIKKGYHLQKEQDLTI